ncbi:MAG TPA: C10 family peptidase [Bacteroidales bacterium]|nr:C10 family peptidase [Bacteroidales bacterium]
MRKFFAIIITLFVVNFLYGSRVPKELAEKIALNHYFQCVNSLDYQVMVKYDDIKLTCIYEPSNIKQEFYYIFNVNEDEGFIIVSADDNIKPILAYSMQSGFNIGNVSPSQQSLLDYYSEMNKAAIEDRLIIKEDIRNEWLELAEFKPENGFKNRTTVEGLLDPIIWNQSYPYNAMCPEASGTYTGYGGRCPVGCSAIAMLQIMKYYNWPSAGVGSYTHTSDENGGFGDFTVNFGQNTYNWYSMPAEGQQYNEELAKMCFHAGVAIRMWWSPEGSAAGPEDVAYALVNYFKYQNSIDLVEKDDYYEEEWKELLRAQIDAKKPIFYVGYSDEAGHAWNCDGYQGEDHFHMNWGWGGYGNGFYTLDALGTQATPGSGEGNYCYWQHALINIFPAGSYPVYCNTELNIDGNEGYFDDGSSFYNYQNNSNCTYIIEPECRQIVFLKFTKFNLASGDVINVWDGDIMDNILVASFDADNPPQDEECVALSGKMTLSFTTDAANTSDGWAVNYRTRTCQSNSYLTQPAGSFDDGSKDCDYSKSTLCSWHIQPPDVNRIEINFDYFDLGGQIDFVRVYKNSINSANLIELYDLNNIPEQALTVEADTAIVQFFSSSTSSLGSGWRINYTSLLSESQDVKLADDLMIFPNPGYINSNIIINQETNCTCEIIVYNILGEMVSTKSCELVSGQNSIPISKILISADTGIYFISLKINEKAYSTRFVLLD